MRLLRRPRETRVTCGIRSTYDEVAATPMAMSSTASRASACSRGVTTAGSCCSNVNTGHNGHRGLTSESFNGHDVGTPGCAVRMWAHTASSWRSGRGDAGDLRLEGTGNLRRRIDNVDAETGDGVRGAAHARGELPGIAIQPDPEQGVSGGPAVAQQGEETQRHSSMLIAAVGPCLPPGPPVRRSCPPVTQSARTGSRPTGS